MSEPAVETTTPVALRQEARERRRAFASTPLSAFVRTMQATMRQYLIARAQGVDREDGVCGLEAELRAAWPGKTTKFPFDCTLCDDTGWREYVCTHEMRCGRKLCAEKHPAEEHPYVASCGCPRGLRNRRQVQTTEDAIAAAGRVQKAKKRGWSQVGS